MSASFTPSLSPQPPDPTPPPTVSCPPARRYLALWCPFLSTDRIRLRQRVTGSGRPDERPLVLVEQAQGGLRIAAADARAAEAGITPGMTLGEVRARHPDIASLEADPQADAAFLARCAEACEMFTPLVALGPENGLVLDISGCAHLFDGETGLMGRARRRLGALGLNVRAAIAGTPEAAWAFARFLPGTISIPGGEAALARALPMRALDMPEDVMLGLMRAGLTRLGDLADRPARLLAARFGAGLVQRLGRVMGHEDIRITPLRPPPGIIAEAHFAQPVTQTDSLLRRLERLARDIGGRLEQREEGGRRFQASLFRSDGAVRHLEIETALPTRDHDSLMRLFTLRIDGLADPIDPGFGFDAIRLAVLRSEPLAPAEPSFDPGTTRAFDEGRALADLVGRLVARFGAASIRRLVTVETHDPVRAGSQVPCLTDDRPSPRPQARTAEEMARPLTLFDPAQPIETLAEVPDGPPLRFFWRGAMHEVAQAEGPERIAPEWWRASEGTGPATRDYYRIEDGTGHRFWVYREGLYGAAAERPRWFLHGLFA